LLRYFPGFKEKNRDRLNYTHLRDKLESIVVNQYFFPQAMNDSTLKSHIKLDQFLKWQGIAQTGGEAKIMIKQGMVEVNGAEEMRRGRKLVTGDRVTIEGTTHRVELQ